jgi:outer membrane protein assembly factor BamA
VTKRKSTYILLLSLFLLGSCHITQNVPEGQYWIKKNKIVVEKNDSDDAKLNEDDLEEIIRQQENYKSLGFRFKLRFYNAVDSTKVAQKRIRKNEKLDRINAERREKEARINERRIAAARANGDSLYTKKIIPLKDTLNPRLFLREWLKYKYGEPPVILDTALFNKTIEQHRNYLRKKGYYYGENFGEITYKKRKRAIVTYHLKSGPRYYIDSVYLEGPNERVKNSYNAYLQVGRLDSLIGVPFDRDILDDYRETASKCFRDDAYYGLSSKHISYIADTNATTMKVTLGIVFSDRVKMSDNMRDTLEVIPFKTTYVRDVYFHISDTTYMTESYMQQVRELGLQPFKGQYLQTLDTTLYAELTLRKSNELDEKRIATFLYNGELFIDPAVLESQNYLEKSHVYKEYYIDRSYSRLMQLGLFQVIKPTIVEVEGTNLIDVHYYLIPSSKQSFGFEPRATNSNGFLGVSASVNYINKNLFGGAQKLTLAFSGGFESQPPVFDPNQEDGLIEQTNTSFNTFEIGPSFQLELPGLFPTKLTALSKRHRPKTVISAAFNFQRRAEFSRNTFQANYMWKMYVSKTQVFQYGLPLLSVLKYVNISKASFFDAQINSLNDLFLRNAYSDQLIWEDFKFVIEYNNKDRDRKVTQFLTYYNGSFDAAGNFISSFQAYQDTNDFGRYQIFGVPYSRFVRVDNDFIVSYPFNKKSSIHYRALAGAGITTGNKETSLPFDYSFYAGGSNDNRGWRARTLGPGGYKYILDTNRTLTQIGDVRLSTSLEYRFSLGPTLKMALFMDAGNIWTYKEDVNRPGSQFTSDWINQIAYSGGFGFRFDLDFFIVRLDFGLKLNNHTLPQGSKWVWQSRDAFNQELIDTFGSEQEVNRLRQENKIPNPFNMQFHFAIGYPF